MQHLEIYNELVYCNLALEPQIMTVQCYNISINSQKQWFYLEAQRIFTTT